MGNFFGVKVVSKIQIRFFIQHNLVFVFIYINDLQQFINQTWRFQSFLGHYFSNH